MKKNDPSNSDFFKSRLKKGDTAAFKILFDTYYTRLCAYALNYVGEKYATEEIVENVFLKLWHKRKKLNKVTYLKSYLYTMVRNEAIDFLKKEKGHISLNIDKHDAAREEHLILTEETHTLLFQALEKLPKKCREVFELSCIEGVKYKDIAEDLEISINTVKSQRARAIKLLRVHLVNHPIYKILLISI